MHHLQRLPQLWWIVSARLCPGTRFLLSTGRKLITSNACPMLASVGSARAGLLRGRMSSIAGLLIKSSHYGTNYQFSICYTSTFTGISPRSNAYLIDKPCSNVLNGKMCQEPSIAEELGYIFNLDGSALSRYTKAAHLHILLQADSSGSASKAVEKFWWAAIASRTMSISTELLPSDALSILQSFSLNGALHDDPLLNCLLEVLLSFSSCLTVEQLAIILQVCGPLKIKGGIPRGSCINGLLKTITLRMPQMNRTELLNIIQAMIASGLRSSMYLHTFRQEAVLVLAIFGCCEVIHFVHLLELADFEIGSKELVLYLRKFDVELELLSNQELFNLLQNDNLAALEGFPISLRLRRQLFEEFFRRTNLFSKAEDVNTLNSPVDCLNFMRSKRLLNKGFITAICHWCLNEIRNFSKGSQRKLRFLPETLMLLHDLCREFAMEEESLKQSIRLMIIKEVDDGILNPKSVEFKPLSYKSGRKYIPREEDMHKEENFGATNVISMSPSVGGPLAAQKTASRIKPSKKYPYIKWKQVTRMDGSKNKQSERP